MHVMVSTVMHFLQTNHTSPQCGLKLGVAGKFSPFLFFFFSNATLFVKLFYPIVFDAVQISLVFV